jgi:hypothetical protein
MVHSRPLYPCTNTDYFSNIAAVYTVLRKGRKDPPGKERDQLDLGAVSNSSRCYSRRPGRRGDQDARGIRSSELVCILVVKQLYAL